MQEVVPLWVLSLLVDDEADAGAAGAREDD